MEFKPKTYTANLSQLEDVAFNAISYAQEIAESGVRVEMVVRPHEGKRSLSANAQQHVWLTEIAKHTGESIPTVTAQMKIEHGLPIILADTEHGPVIEWMLKKIGFYNMCYEQQLKAIKYIPVTRLFTPRQHNSYRDSLQVAAQGMGVYLEYKD